MLMARLDERTWAAVTAHKDTKLDLPAPAEAITAFEAAHGVTLPPSHRTFLQRGNGGVVGYVRLFGVGRSDALDLGHVVSRMRPYIEGMAEGAILPVANDWGGSYFCYDLRQPDSEGEYPVLLWHHEYSEEPDDRPMLWSTFAAHFVAFVNEVVKD
jgi:cell wall assembly regulator SMI1